MFSVVWPNDFTFICGRSNGQVQLRLIALVTGGSWTPSEKVVISTGPRTTIPKHCFPHRKLAVEIVPVTTQQVRTNLKNPIEPSMASVNMSCRSVHRGLASESPLVRLSLKNHRLLISVYDFPSEPLTSISAGAPTT